MLNKFFIRDSFFFVILGLLLPVFSIAQDFSTHVSKDSYNSYCISLTIDHWRINDFSYDGNNFSLITLDKTSNKTNKKGWPELPIVSSSIQLPADKNFDLSVVSSQYTDYQLTNSVIPSRGTIYRDQDPDSVPYAVDPLSMIDKFYPSFIATMDKPFIIRDVRGTSVHFNPFQYNSATKTLRVYKKIVVQLTENQEIPDNPLSYSSKPPVKEMVGIYKSLFQNFEDNKEVLPFSQNGELLVITTPRDNDAIEPYIRWKTEKGFIVHKEVVEPNTNVKSLIQQSYNANNNILYVQLVGDWEDIKSDNSIDDSPTDPKLGCVAGNDNFPDLAVGRFSCSNSDDLEVQIRKSIEYEKYPDMTHNWRGSFCGIGSEEGVGDDMEYDSTHIQRIYTERMNPLLFYSTHYGNYGTHANSDDIADQVNNGISAIAYCGHGSSTAWSTSGFSNSDISQLSNGSKLPFITSVACFNGSFHKQTDDCFAEYWLKKEDGGAVIAWMSSISQAWTPPMRGEDYFYDILAGGFDYSSYPGQNGISTNERRTTWGSVILNSFSLMLTESSDIDDVETVHTWCTFGDVTLQLRTQTPIEITCLSDSILFGQPFTANILTIDGDVIDNALVSISQDDVFYTAYSDESGFVSIDNDFTPGQISIVVTAFNTTTITKTINCYSADAPYLVIDTINISDDILKYGSTSDISLTMTNFGYLPAENVNISISTEDPYLTFVKSSQVLEVADPFKTVDLVDAFRVSVSEEVPNNHKSLCLVCFDYDGVQIFQELILTSYSVVPQFVNYGWEGDLIPGETLNITATFCNDGGVDILDVYGSYSQTSQYITINDDMPIHFGNIEKGDTVTYSFSITVSPDTPYGTEIPSIVELEGMNNFSFKAEFVPIIEECNMSVNDFPYQEGFEDSIPNCWTQENIEVASGATAFWKVGKGGTGERPPAPHSGENNLVISGRDGATTKLITPVLNLLEAESAELSFWYSQFTNYIYTDELRIYYKNSINGPWHLLAEYTTRMTVWKERTITLPDLTSNYYIAFEATCNGGYGVVIDDIQVTRHIDGLAAEKNDSFDEISIYPNPTKDILNIEGDYINNVSVIDMYGRTLERFNVNNNKITINTLKYGCGIYIISVATTDRIMMKKVIIQ